MLMQVSESTLPSYMCTTTCDLRCQIICVGQYDLLDVSYSFLYSIGARDGISFGSVRFSTKVFIARFVRSCSLLKSEGSRPY